MGIRTIVQAVIQGASNAINYLFTQKLAYKLTTYLSAVLASLKPAYRVVQIVYTYLGLYGAATAASATQGGTSTNWSSPNNAVGNKNATNATLAATLTASVNADLNLTYANVTGKTAFPITKVELVFNAAMTLGLLQTGSMKYTLNLPTGGSASVPNATFTIANSARASTAGIKLTATAGPISLVGVNGAGGGTANAVAYPSGLVAGDILILSTTATTAKLTPLPAGFNQISSGVMTFSNAEFTTRVATKVSDGTETGTVPFTTEVNTIGGNQAAATMAAYRGVSAATLMSSQTTSTAATTVTVPGFSAASQDLAVFIVQPATNASGSTVTSTPPGGVTERAEGNGANTAAASTACAHDDQAMVTTGLNVDLFTTTAAFTHTDQAYDITSYIAGDYTKLGALTVKVNAQAASSAVAGSASVDSVELRVTTSPIYQAA